jgi:hypothetical protein
MPGSKGLIEYRLYPDSQYVHYAPPHLTVTLQVVCRLRGSLEPLKLQVPVFTSFEDSATSPRQNADVNLDSALSAGAGSPHALSHLLHAFGANAKLYVFPVFCVGLITPHVRKMEILCPFLFDEVGR